MSKVFRKRGRRITALLMAVAVMTGSMDLSMLSVRAQEENAEAEPNTGTQEDLTAQTDTGMTEKTAGEVVPVQNPEEMEGTVNENSDGASRIQPGPDSMPKNVQAEIGTETVETYDNPIVMQEGTPVAQADGEDINPAPTGPQKVKIVSDITVPNMIYDGSPARAGGKLKAVVLKEDSASGKEEDVTDKVMFKYSVSGTKEDGSAYGPNEGTVPNDGTIVDMPSDAGIYTLTIVVEDTSGAYEGSGSWSTQFKINKKALTIKVNDKRKRIGEELPEWLQSSPDPDVKPEQGKDYTVNGLLDRDKKQFIPPTLICDITDETKDKPGTYTITALGADAGPNYTISYLDGVLTVSAKETVTISGIAISDKEYNSEPVVLDISGVRVSGEGGTELADLKTSLRYSISGGQKDGTLYFWSDTPQTQEDLDEEGDGEDKPVQQKTLPTEAGTYTLKVTVASDKYWGEYRKDFSITQKPVTLTAVDKDIKQGDEIPTEFEYTTEGLLNKDPITKEPEYTCDIFSTEKTGKYTITPREASAGPNYKIIYVPGTLTVLEKDRLTITGLTTTPSPKVYDGQPVVCNTDNLKVMLNQSGKPGTDITDQVEFEYSIEGRLANGKGYSKPNIENGMPNEAGDYTITVTATSKPEVAEKYRGSMEYSFSIAQRPLIIKANDLEIKTEDKLPERDDYSYEIGGMGLAGDDKLQKEPTFTCDIQNTDMVGQYDIVVSDADAGFNYRIDYQSGTLTVLEKEIVKTRNLLRIIAPPPVLNVDNGTRFDKLPLPEAVTVVTRDIGAEETVLTERNETAAVVWDRVAIDGTAYSPRNEDEQTFTLGGTVVLPAEVDANTVSLAVKIEVTVREKYAVNDPVATPTASIASGSGVRRGTTIRLSCETEGAEIYYTLDSTKPDRKSNLYANPIEVNVNGFTVIWAYAHKKGQPDSATVKFYYYINSQNGGEGDEPEVPKEDIPDSGIVPEGLWVTKVQEYTYTGKAIKPEVRVYDYKTRLEEKKDYTISYANNTKAADQNAEKAPSIIIIGKGNYEGKLTKHFTIVPKDIRDTDVSVDDIAVAYDSKRLQKPVPAVFWNGKKLAAKRDYTVPDVGYTDAGDYSVTVTGTGNYKGERTFKFTITEGILVSKLTIGKIPNQTYTGKAIVPPVTVKYKGRELTPDTDYTARCVPGTNVNVGTATLLIEGKGSYAGTRKVTFKIVEIASLSKAKVELKFTNAPTHTGKEVRADREVVTISLKENGQIVTRTLTGGTDYEVVYTNNVKAGTATATFTGKGAYSGKLKKTFKIAACEIGRTNIRLNKSYSYVKGGCKPEPIITFGGKTLKAGTDYTLAYKQNNVAGSKAILTIKGKGNFKGSVDRAFEVAQQDIGKMTVSAVDKVYQEKKNIYKTTVQVTDTNGKKLAAGRDYDKNVAYTYVERTLINKVYKKAGDPVEQDDIIPEGTQIKVTVTAKDADYYGTVSGTYRIVKANISGAKVTVPVQSYTGKDVKLDKSLIRAELKGTVLKYGVDYEILEDTYSNNINKGTAKVMIHGIGNYGGTKMVTFKIKGKGLLGL